MGKGCLAGQDGEEEIWSLGNVYVIDRFHIVFREDLNNLESPSELWSRSGGH